MADPLSIAASLLTVTTAAVQSAKSLHETVKRFKGRDQTLRRLLDELEALTNILDSLAEVVNAEQFMLRLLKGPIERCGQVCREFEQSMEAFSAKSKMGFRDWTKMEFMRGGINEFISRIADYKSTISVGLGTITVHTSKVSQQVLHDYNELIQDTTYSLEIQLRRIDEKMTQFGVEDNDAPGAGVDFEDERDVTKQCLRICEDARSYIESLLRRKAPLLPEAPQNPVAEGPFEAQWRTRQTLDGNRYSFEVTIEHLRNRLESLVRNDGPENDNERSRLLADIDISKQCMDVCKVASEVSRQKVYTIGEVIADGNSDQVVVTTLADLFDVKKALSKDSSAQLIGSMTEENLRYLTEKRYSSRFGALEGDSEPATAGASSSSAMIEPQQSEHAFGSQIRKHEHSPEPRINQSRSFANEMRKRQMDGTVNQGKRL